MKLLVTLSLVTAFLLNGCASFNTPPPAWNIKEIKTAPYVNRVNRSPDYQSLSTYLSQKGLSLSILEQDSDSARGALAGIYADGLYYNFTDEDTAQHIRERTGSLMSEILGGLEGPSDWVVGYCIDFSNGIANVDMSSIKADLYYSLSYMSASHLAARPHNLKSCDSDGGITPIYRGKARLTATFDGAKTGYTVVNPAKPLREIERFDVTLSDLTYQAAEIILTDRKLLDALRKATATLADRPSKLNQDDAKALCTQLKLGNATSAFKECVQKLSGT